MCKYQKAMRALESLTPSGSEFVGDVERCLSHVRDRIETQHRLILKFSHQAKELKAKLATTTTAARYEIEATGMLRDAGTKSKGGVS